MFLRYNWPALAWALFILIICGIPGNELPKINFWQWLRWDKLVHLGIYTILALLLIRGLSEQSDFLNLRRSPKLSAFLICTFYGMIVEILQATVFVHRSGDVRDAIANSLGALIGVFLFDKMTRFFPSSRRS
jgi:VanZ family protein